MIHQKLAFLSRSDADNFDGVCSRKRQIINKTVYCKSGIALLVVLFWVRLIGDAQSKKVFSVFKYQCLLTGNFE